ncbi:hypothetical protein HYV44_00815 [Candidatus Microgenomates bacterium]|nr:hypothetical protein [Candidatus Microgenomates bacterium]
MTHGLEKRITTMEMAILDLTVENEIIMMNVLAKAPEPKPKYHVAHKDADRVLEQVVSAYPKRHSGIQQEIQRVDQVGKRSTLLRKAPMMIDGVVKIDECTTLEIVDPRKPINDPCGIETAVEKVPSKLHSPECNKMMETYSRCLRDNGL